MQIGLTKGFRFPLPTVYGMQEKAIYILAGIGAIVVLCVLGWIVAGVLR